MSNELSFMPLNLALLTVSDTRSLQEDKSGDVLRDRIQAAGHMLVARALVPDELERIRAQVAEWVEDEAVDAVITTGGTGLTGRDVTPEAIQPLFTKEIPGFGEVFRFLSYQKIGTSTLQSRALAGVAQDTYVFVLPGSPGACKDAWDGILVHQLDARTRPCNLVEILPRLAETERAKVLREPDPQDVLDVEPEDAASFRAQS